MSWLLDVLQPPNEDNELLVEQVVVQAESRDEAIQKLMEEDDNRLVVGSREVEE